MLGKTVTRDMYLEPLPQCFSRQPAPALRFEAPHPLVLSFFINLIGASLTKSETGFSYGRNGTSCTSIVISRLSVSLYVKLALTLLDDFISTIAREKDGS